METAVVATVLGAHSVFLIHYGGMETLGFRKIQMTASGISNPLW